MDMVFIMDLVFNAQLVNTLHLAELHSVLIAQQDAQLARLIISPILPHAQLVKLTISLLMEAVTHAQQASSLKEETKLNALTVQLDAQTAQEHHQTVQLAHHAQSIIHLPLMEHATLVPVVQHLQVELFLIVLLALQTAPLVLITQLVIV